MHIQTGREIQCRAAAMRSGFFCRNSNAEFPFDTPKRPLYYVKTFYTMQRYQSRDFNSIFRESVTVRAVTNGNSRGSSLGITLLSVVPGDPCPARANHKTPKAEALQ